MRKELQAKYLAAEIHALLFISMWVLNWAFSQPVTDGPSAFLFFLLHIADLPISFPAFAVMFTSSEMGTVAAVLWGIFATLWWFAIGFAIDARIRNYRMKRSRESDQIPATAMAKGMGTDYRRRELLVAATIVAIVIVGSSVWEWNGRQGHFEEGKIGDFAFAPDGQSIVLLRSQGDSSRMEKVALNSDTSTPTGKALPCMGSSPTYSSDGRTIALSCESKATGLSRILIMDADGGNLHPLFSTNSDNYDFGPHFPPDGLEIYFGRSPSFIKDTGRGGVIAPGGTFIPLI